MSEEYKEFGEIVGKRDKCQCGHIYLLHLSPEGNRGTYTFCDKCECREFMSENETPILKLRFVLLETEIIMEVLCADRKILFSDSEIVLKSPQSEIWQWIYDKPEWNTFRYSRFAFAEIKQALSEFAESLDGKKPVPRIERDANRDCYLFDGDPAPLWLSERNLSNLAVLFGSPKEKSLPIYEPKQFKGEWTKISPREFTINDVAQMVPLPSMAGKTPEHAGRLVDLPLKDVMVHTLESINKMQTDTPEVWVFEIK